MIKNLNYLWLIIICGLPVYLVCGHNQFTYTPLKYSALSIARICFKSLWGQIMIHWFDSCSPWCKAYSPNNSWPGFTSRSGHLLLVISSSTSFSCSLSNKGYRLLKMNVWTMWMWTKSWHLARLMMQSQSNSAQVSFMKCDDHSTFTVYVLISGRENAGTCVMKIWNVMF